MLSVIEIHIVVAGLQPDKKVAGRRIIIITRRLQLQATVKRFRGDPENDLEIDLADYYGLTILLEQYLLKYKSKDQRMYVMTVFYSFGVIMSS